MPRASAVASGNVNLKAGDNAVIAGSKVTAGGSFGVEGDSVSVIGAEEQHELESSKKKSGLFAGSGDGFISLWGKEQKDKGKASELNVASVLTPGTDVTIKARESDVKANDVVPAFRFERHQRQRLAPGMNQLIGYTQARKAPAEPS